MMVNYLYRTKIALDRWFCELVYTTFVYLTFILHCISAGESLIFLNMFLHIWRFVSSSNFSELSKIRPSLKNTANYLSKNIFEKKRTKHCLQSTSFADPLILHIPTSITYRYIGKILQGTAFVLDPTFFTKV